MDGTGFVLGILEGNCDLSYQTTLTKPYQEKPGEYSIILKILTPTPNTKTNKLQQKLGKWIGTHSKCGKWLLYQNKNQHFYARETNKDIEWKVYKRTNKGIQLICTNTTEESQPIKYSILVLF